MARISELHYSNNYSTQTGVGEFLEVALQPGEDPADFTVGFYEADGTLGIEINLQQGVTDGLITPVTDPQNGEIVYVISEDNYPLFLTDPDGTSANNYEAYALTNIATNTLIDFYDIGGGTQNIVAQSGAAFTAALPGQAVSENIPTPSGPQTVGASIQFNQPDPDTAVFEPLTPGDTGLACFVAGTLVLTPDGPRPVETLLSGDMIETRDQGAQPICWSGQRTVPGQGRFAPIRFAAGRYGATDDVLVSPQHRVLVEGLQAEIYFGESEVLVPAKALLDDQFVTRAPAPLVTYVHVMCADHQIVTTHGLQSESYYPWARHAQGWADDVARELITLFPALDTDTPPPLARPVIPVHLARVLGQR